MKKHGARLLFVLCCVLAAAAVFQDFRFDRSHHQERTRLLAIEREAGELVSTLGEMRAAQMAYLATGQGPEFWMRRVTDLSDHLGAGLDRLRETMTEPNAQAHINTASTALGDLMKLDGRARAALQSEQRFLASDLIFAEAVGGAQLVTESLTMARDAELSQAEAVLQRESYARLAAMPLALALVLLSAYALGRQQRPPARSAAEEVAQMIRDLPPPVKSPVATPASTASAGTSPKPPAQPASPAAAVAVAAVPAAPPVDWTSAAELCVDLARVMDARDMPSLVQRAAQTLDATGIIVWVVDAGGETLTPALAHGYSDRVLTKLGTLAVSADNVTSLSFRSMRPQSMPGIGKDGATSAIAVPLVTTLGCNGVLAAEIQSSQPAPECIAIARILAAQLATILSPLEPSAQKAAEA